jgi:phosphatidylethanolamine N-methyltransferase
VGANTYLVLDAVDRPAVMDFASVRECLMRIVTLCLDADPSLVPLSSRADNNVRESADHDPDDFRFWSEQQAKRICKAIKQAFDVEYAPQVIVAHANLSALANRILLSKEILTT